MNTHRSRATSCFPRRGITPALLFLATAATPLAQPQAGPPGGGAKMLQKQFYVAFMRPVGDTLNVEDPKVRPILMQHLASVRRLEKEGVLFMAGPFRDARRPEQWDGSGMIIIRADSSEEARAIFANDPLVKAGLRTVEVSGWMLNEGSFRATIRFSEAKVTLE